MIINLTPHAINILGTVNGDITIPPSGRVARVSAETEHAGVIGGLPIVRTTYGQATDLPAAESGTWYIVSSIVRAAYPARGDLLTPAELVRDDDGRVIGCRALSV
jgi:hypothetical protein